MRLPKYKVAELAIEVADNGDITYWVYTLGWYPVQGGMEWIEGNTGFDTLDVAVKWLKTRLDVDGEELIEKIKDKNGSGK